MDVFIGISASGGTGIGPAFIIPEQIKKTIPQKQIAANETDEGWQRFEIAKKSISADIAENLARLSKENKANDIQREIFETYIQMLEDPVFLQEVKHQFEATLFSIEYTIDLKAKEYAEKLRSAGNAYLAERAQDILDVFGRVLNEMLGIHSFDINTVPEGSVIVASTINPTDAIVLSKKAVAGLVLADGGVSSHTVILARNYGIPAIVGVDIAAVRNKLNNGETVIVDSNAAKVFIAPDEEVISEYESRIIKEKREQFLLKAYLDKPAVTEDGVKFSLYANIGTPEEAEIALKEGADGIGLFRTEFLYMSRTDGSSDAASKPFAEDEQFEAYKKVLTVMKDKPVTIRTLDAGGDKLVKSVDIPNIAETNPLMGMRAIRLCLAHKHIFKTQLRALYRASVFGDLRILLPLVTTFEQVTDSFAVIEEVKSELKAENIPFKEDVPVGVMIETAAAAVASDCLAEVCGFFSIGTNDLTQYTLGVDRENPAVAPLYDEFNISVLRLINMTVLSAKRHGLPVAVCGEMAGRQDGILVLAGLGIRILSMSPKLISKTKELLSRFSMAELQAISSAKINKL